MAIRTFIVLALALALAAAFARGDVSTRRRPTRSSR